MPTKIKHAAAAAGLEAEAGRLERLIDALAEDLAEASDEEVLQACADLGMNPEMRGSAAFIGLKGPSVSLEEFFDLEELQRMLAAFTPAQRAILRKQYTRGVRLFMTAARAKSGDTKAATAGDDDDGDAQ
jgi:hypothetical protein